MNRLLAGIIYYREWKSAKEVSPNSSFLRKRLQSSKLQWGFPDVVNALMNLREKLNSEPVSA